MKKNFGFDTEFNKLRVIACSLWMGFKRGEGELEIEDQGRLQKSRFSQETVAIGQQTPRIGEDRPKLRLAPNTQVFTRVSSAGSTLNSDSTPQFFSALPEREFSSPAKQEISSQEEKPLSSPAESKITISAKQSSFALDESEFFFSEEAEKIHKDKMDLKFSQGIQNTQNALSEILQTALGDEDSAV